jgi:hypothetical protein
MGHCTAVSSVAAWGAKQPEENIGAREPNRAGRIEFGRFRRALRKARPGSVLSSQCNRPSKPSASVSSGLRATQK